MKSLLLNFHDSILILAIAQALAMAATLLAVKINRNPANRSVAIVLILLAGMLLSNLLIWGDGLYGTPISQSLFSSVLLVVSLMLQGPLLIVALLSTQGHPKVTPKFWAVHGLVSVLLVMILTTFNLGGRDITHFDAPDGTRGLVATIVWTLLKLWLLVYLGYCLQWAKRHDLFAGNSDQHESASEKWHRWQVLLLIGGLGTLWCWGAITFLVDRAIGVPSTWADYMGIAGNYLTWVFINALLIFGLAYTREALIDKTKKPAVRVNEEKGQEIKQAIEHAINVERVYLHNDINLERFCERIGFRPREVSNVINKEYECNFFELINQNRVGEAKRLLSSTEHAHRSILDILHESGFNSQSAFHRFFKRYTNMTPSQFRKQIKASG